MLSQRNMGIFLLMLATALGQSLVFKTSLNSSLLIAIFIVSFSLFLYNQPKPSTPPQMAKIESARQGSAVSSSSEMDKSMTPTTTDDEMDADDPLLEAAFSLQYSKILTCALLCSATATLRLAQTPFSSDVFSCSLFLFDPSDETW